MIAQEGQYILDFPIWIVFCIGFKFKPLEDIHLVAVLRKPCGEGKRKGSLCQLVHQNFVINTLKFNRDAQIF